MTGIWSGENAAYSGAAQPIPSHYVETPQRLALHLEVLLGLVKVLASQSDTERLTVPSGFEPRAASDCQGGGDSRRLPRTGLTRLVRAPPDGAAIAHVASADPAASRIAISVSVADVLDVAARGSTGKPFPIATRDW